MGGVPSPPSAQGQVVGSEGSAESDGEEEDCDGEKVVVEEKERPPPLAANNSSCSQLV